MKMIRYLANALNSIFRRSSLSHKITAPYLFLAIVLVISASFLLSSIIFNTIEERFNNQLGEAGKLSSEFMVVEENNLIETVRLLANSQHLADQIARHDPEALRSLALGIAINQGADAVEFLDNEGYLVLSMRHNQGGSVEDYAFTTGGDRAIFESWEFVNKVLKNQPDNLGDKYSGFVEADWGKYFYVSGPVYDSSDQFVGVILVGTRMEDLVNRLRANVLAQITFYTQDGRVVESSFPYAPPDLSPELVSKVLLSQDDGSSPLRDIEDKRNISVINLNYYEILGPWEVRGDRDLGVIGSSLQQDFVIKQNAFTRLQVAAIIALAFVLIIFIGISLSRTITNPLNDLVLATQEIANGNMDVKVDLRTEDELSLVAESFNGMVVSLKQSRGELLNAYDMSLQGWAKALEYRDRDTKGHTERVVRMAVLLAKNFDVDEETLTSIRRGATLHDIGKIGIPDEILHKAGPLTDDEWLIMKKHPEIAFDMLKDIQFIRPALEIPLYHHEHWDGSGYPYGLKGEDIPLPARIFAVVDVWDALTHDRSYRKKMSYDYALSILEEGTGMIYDPIVVNHFKECLKNMD